MKTLAILTIASGTLAMATPIQPQATFFWGACCAFFSLMVATIVFPTRR